MIEVIAYLITLSFGVYMGYRLGVDDIKARYEGKPLPTMQDSES